MKIKCSWLKPNERHWRRKKWMKKNNAIPKKSTTNNKFNQSTIITTFQLLFFLAAVVVCRRWWLWWALAYTVLKIKLISHLIPNERKQQINLNEFHWLQTVCQMVALFRQFVDFLFVASFIYSFFTFKNRLEYIYLWIASPFTKQKKRRKNICVIVIFDFCELFISIFL